jgi:hypothetical protein
VNCYLASALRDPFSHFGRPHLMLAALFLIGMAAASGCVGIPGNPSGNLLQANTEVLYMPADFHPSKNSGPPDSWGVFALSGNELSQYHLVGTEQPTAGFMCLRQTDYERKDSNSVPDAVIIVVGRKPAEPPRTTALEVETVAEAQCPAGGSRTDLTNTSDQYALDEVVPACGTRPPSERVIRVVYGQWNAFKISYVKRGATLDSHQREQAVQLVSSFSVGKCPSPLADCSVPLFFASK